MIATLRLTLAAVSLAATAQAAPFATAPTGQAITPTAAPGARFESLNPGLAALPDFTAGQASATALSPDGKTLLILTSGFNRNFGPDGKQVPDLSREYVFVYDVTGAQPVKRQVLKIDNSFLGLAWAPDGQGFYVSGGVDDDVVAFARKEDGFALSRTYKLGHTKALGIAVKPEAAGVAVSPDGWRLLVANVQNDSVSLVDLASGTVTELDLRRGAGVAGGTYPRAVVFASDTTAYVTSNAAALPLMQQAVTIDPTEPDEVLLLADLVAMTGQPAEADKMLADLGQKWPDMRDIRLYRLNQALWRKDWAAARTFLDALPDGPEKQAFPALLDALARGDVAGARAAGAPFVQITRDPHTATVSSINALAVAGYVDDAVDALRLGVSQDMTLIQLAYRPPFGAVRKSARFAALAKELGLIDYWRMPGHRPDFCNEPNPAALCATVSKT